MISQFPASEPQFADRASHRIQGFLTGGSGNLSPNQDQVIAAMVAVAPGQIRTVVAGANTKGSGTTIVDLRKNGVSMYHDPTHRPTLPSGAGKFLGYVPDDRTIQVGDLITLVVVQVSSGSSGVVATAAIEEPWA